MKLPEAIHFIGIGGAGMAPMAELLLARGVKISGSDLAFNEKCRHLEEGGAVIRTGHASENVPDDTGMIVFSSAVQEDNPERIRGRELNIPEMRRGEFLAFFLSLYRRVAAVSGSHGKSSITAMLCTILEYCSCDPGALVGAARNQGSSALSGNGDIFVTEVDESDGTHTCVTPFLGIVPNIDEDHEWSVGGAEALKENFRTFGRNCKKLLIADTPELNGFFENHPALSKAPQPDAFAGFYGFMAKNAALAVHGAVMLGVPYEKAVEAVSTFTGIERRMGVLSQKDELIYLEDYAHHPTEVRNSIELVRKLYPGKELHVVFQPHRYARLERFFEGFCKELAQADKVIVTPVFAAWCETGEVNSNSLCEKIANAEYCGLPWKELAGQLKKMSGNKTVLLLGAGDISELAALLK